ncbi:Motility associated factor glycosyltransferase family protein [Sulfidibacter corallicola]|uniref:Motility associated factor glycosyltransferase family protein n=1 Tax=Sulfidibacter corallicola TaxID=2818388 RepID=A0A8A4TVQ4_SULCO|nr:6-hydroxymethylpterin diphosphokinase MptE-like protein [Sulfidibacter corallicola]QTD53447.1 motility associated factor glycosyltransferase family protein [Sulfidibacter corallicola]
MTSFEEVNLTCLRRWDPDLVLALGCLDTAADVRVQPARKGGLTLAKSGRFVHSRYDPIKEAISVVGATTDGAEPGDAALHIHFGFGLGFFAEADAPPSATPMLVFEPETDFVRAALRHRDLRRLTDQGRCHLCLDLKRLRLLLRRHLTKGVRKLSLVFSPYHRQQFPQLLTEFLELIKSERNRLGVVQQAERTLFRDFMTATLQAFPLWSRAPGAERLVNHYRGLPAVIAVAGPSLERNLADLTPFRDRVLVFALARTARALERYGIEPHFLVHTEAEDYRHLIDTCTHLTRTIFLLSEQCHHQMHSVPHQATYIYQNPTNLVSRWLADRQPKLRHLPLPTAGSVATEAFSLATLFGCDPVILIGQDLANSGKRHYAASHYNPAFAFTANDRRSTRGYFGGKVDTFAHYLHFRDWYGEALESYRARSPARAFFNATEGGAHLPGFDRCKLREALIREAVSAETIRNRLDRLPALDPSEAVTAAERASVIGEIRQRLDRIRRGVRAFTAFRNEVAGSASRLERQPDWRREVVQKLIRFNRHFGEWQNELPFLGAFLPEDLQVEAADRPASTEPDLIRELTELAHLFGALDQALDSLTPIVAELDRAMEEGS